MIRLSDIRYVRLGTRDPQGTDRFLQHVLGLSLVRQERDSRYYSSDERDHTLVCFEGDPSQQTIGFEVEDTGTLDAAAGMLDAMGIAVRAGGASACEQRRVVAFAVSGSACRCTRGDGWPWPWAFSPRCS